MKVSDIHKMILEHMRATEKLANAMQNEFEHKGICPKEALLACLMLAGKLCGNNELSKSLSMNYFKYICRAVEEGEENE